MDSWRLPRSGGHQKVGESADGSRDTVDQSTSNWAEYTVGLSDGATMTGKFRVTRDMVIIT